MSDFIFLCQDHACSPFTCRGYRKCPAETKAMRRQHDQALRDANPSASATCCVCGKTTLLGHCANCAPRGDYSDLY